MLDQVSKCSHYSLSTLPYRLLFFFFNDTATTEIYTLSLHDALPISRYVEKNSRLGPRTLSWFAYTRTYWGYARSEEHTSELQSQSNLVCRLLLEKKKIRRYNIMTTTWRPTMRTRSSVTLRNTRPKTG